MVVVDDDDDDDDDDEEEEEEEIYDERSGLRCILWIWRRDRDLDCLPVDLLCEVYMQISSSNTDKISPTY